MCEIKTITLKYQLEVSISTFQKLHENFYPYAKLDKTTFAFFEDSLSRSRLNRVVIVSFLSYN